MNSMDPLERALTAWLADTAAPARPDDVEDILLETATMRQRPRWTFVVPLSRPMDDRFAGRLVRSGAPRRTALILALVGLLLVGLATLFAGSRPRVPPPFGAAGNGLVAYEQGGDIFTADPVTGERRAISVGPESDHDPRWSLDGRQLAFLRGTDPDRLVVTDAEGRLRIVTEQPLVAVDADSMAWSPDGRTIALAAGPDGARNIQLVDTVDGRVMTLRVGYWSLEILWRPPDGRELIFVGGTDARIAFFRYSLDSGNVAEVPGTAVVRPDREQRGSLRPVGWTPDGARFAYHRATDSRRGSETRVVDVRTGDEIVLPVAYGRISNDGKRIVGLDTDGERDWLCVASTGGGPCTPIDGPAYVVDGAGFASFQWAPDDRWIRVAPAPGPVILLDPNGSPMRQPEWATEGGDSWQRVAP